MKVMHNVRLDPHEGDKNYQYDADRKALTVALTPAQVHVGEAWEHALFSTLGQAPLANPETDPAKPIDDQ